MATSTLRALLLAALVIGGLVGLTKAFPEGGGVVVPSRASGATTSPTPTPSASRSTTTRPTQTPKVKGVVVQVLNGSGVTGLATTTTATLKKAGYTMKTPGNAARSSVTIVYYQAGEQIDARGLADTYFPQAELKPATQAAASDADITVVLGEDYGASAAQSA